MKLEILIKADHGAEERLHAGLADLKSVHHIVETTTRHNDKHFAMNFLFEAETPDNFLEHLATLAAEIENSLPRSRNIDIHVKNLEGSEPTLLPGKNGRPFVPVKGIRIVPWPGTENIAPEPHDILLDPADAFGNGLHPSTRLCLELLKQVAEHDAEEKYPPRSVLDIGCGSGILTIAALRLGACCALGIEINQHSVQTARRNLAINQLADSARILGSSWQNLAEHFDLVLANLVPSVLLKAAPCMTKLLNRQGLLITAGFPAEKNAEILRLLEENGLHLITESSLDGWGALLLSH